MRSSFEWLTAQLSGHEIGWSLGTFGAIAEFVRDKDEDVSLVLSDDCASAVTSRGGIRITGNPELRLFASESPTKESWNQRVSLCLPAERCAMSRGAVLTELGPDAEALRQDDRESILFDLGLDVLQADLCVRISDRSLVERLRSFAGRSLFEPGNAAAGMILASSPHRVFVSRVGRVEVFQPIPPADGKSPEGPHTHLMPKLLTHKRTHPATEPVPDGWVPCAHLYPPHPAKDAMGRPQTFRNEHYRFFQETLSRYGDPELISLKSDVHSAVAAGEKPSAVSLANRRMARATVRVALRQLQALSIRSPSLADWVALYDRPLDQDTDDPVAEAHAG